MIATPTRRKPIPATVRVAVYTRKSVSEGLEQEFNTLDAQREAVEAYVKSQRAQGWTALPEHYDDGGYTGANTDRPAFQRLLSDVQTGRVDVVAVYKIDRLSRSLTDFTRLLDLFNDHGVSFVSVTQSFDTSTPMGRMVVNLLATFAQFERETTAERVRDKMTASRRKGMWTGGRPVLGYDVVEKRLVINEEEAERVREIFTLYRQVRSLLSVAQELTSRGWSNKSWTKKDGTQIKGRRFTKTSVHALLTNPMYPGKIRCGTELVEGQHEAIIDQETWDETQALLSNKAVRRRPSTKNAAVLSGLLQCSCGASMNHHATHRHGKRYSYYVCARALKEGAATCPGSRASAGELEAFVVERIRKVGRDPKILKATLEADQADREARRPELQAEVRRLATERTRLQTERGNLVDAITKGATTLVDQLAQADERLAEADQLVQEARGDLLALDLGIVNVTDLQGALEEFEPLWEQLVPKERARVLALLLERVVFDAESGEVEITFRRFQ